VAWNFHPKGQIIIDRKAFSDEDKLMTVALDAGAEDIKTADPEIFEVVTPTSELEKVKTALSGAAIPVQSAEATMLPGTMVTLTGGDAQKMMDLIDELENHDDVKEVYANCDIKE
jgi:transcriptional/translational regulatory protein YebC/TACO1